MGADVDLPVVKLQPKGFKDSFQCQHKSSSYHRITRPRISQLLTFFIVHHRRDVNTLHMPWINLLFIKQFPTTSSRRRQSERKPLDIGHARQWTGWLGFLAHRQVDGGTVRSDAITISSTSDEIGLTERCSMPIPPFPSENFVRKATLNLLTRSSQSLMNFCGFFPAIPGLNGWVGWRYADYRRQPRWYHLTSRDMIWRGWSFGLRKQMLSHSDQIDRYVSIRVHVCNRDLSIPHEKLRRVVLHPFGSRSSDLRNHR